MKLLFIIIPALLAMLLSRVLIPFIILVTYKKRLFDPIDARKLHQRAIPRLGGVAFAPIQCCVLVVTLVTMIKVVNMQLGVQSWAILPALMMLLCGLVILFIIGIGDDLIGINYKWKFMVQLIVASFFPLSGLYLNDLYGFIGVSSIPAWIGIPLTMFTVVLIINAINLIDGLDGLCSGVVVVGCSVLGTLFIGYGAWLHALFAFITVGVLLPFFFINVYGVTRRRRQIFMGDTGSMTLGYSIAFLAISFAMNNIYIKPFSQGAIVVGFSTLIVPIFDVARVICVRWYQGKPLFKPDRNHLHHLLLQTGLSHRMTMVSILLLTLFFCAFNILIVEMVDVNIVVLANIVIWFLFLMGCSLFEKKKLPAKSAHSKKESIPNKKINPKVEIFKNLY
ncbi:MAG: UDP-phosphate alpha-N-acetylglucosaminyltransferase [Sphingobacterium sp.]|jgi:UDP-N-acetylmuramyl pentapeptide phosphotransferase/UDP-N-acetylglucosamine-1-phosphate transferase|nr:UDP-phosphate alpha-N-acetylglucosaminyltransferase [Sphingobacterium sp.]